MELSKPELEQWVDDLFEESDKKIFEIFERMIKLGRSAIDTIENGASSQ